MLIERKFENRATYSYNNYVCPRCLYVLNECKCRVFPPHGLIMIDRKIQHIIRVLNRKGYTTIGCCEGHYGSMSPFLHVIFNREYDYDLPDGFTEIKNGRGFERKYNLRISAEDYEVEKEKYIKILEDWAEKLPDLKP